MERRKAWLIAVEIACFVAIVLALVHNRMPFAFSGGDTSGLPKTYTLQSLDGHPMSSMDFQGKAIVLNFWAPWCPPCRLEIPWLQNLQNRNDSKLVVVGVVADNSQYEQAAAFMKARGITYPLAEDSPLLNQAFGEVSTLPTTFYLSPSGRVVHEVTGIIPPPMMALYSRDALNAK